jgi:hypothetical protein
MTFPMSPQDALDALCADFEVGGPHYNASDVQIADFQGVWPDRSIVKLPEAGHFQSGRCTRKHLKERRVPRAGPEQTLAPRVGG